MSAEQGSGSAPSDDTRASILRAATALLREMDFDGLTYRALAERVSISERTVFRQFPNRSNLLEAIASWVDTEESRAPRAGTVEGLVDAAAESFARFSADPNLGIALARSMVIYPSSPPERSTRTSAIESALDSSNPRLNPRDRTRVLAMLSQFTGAPFWSQLRLDLELEADEIADTLRWATTLALHDVTTRSEPA